ncbi:MAG: DNA-processing protein DprA [Firmicutes bacterium]|nr:DNA-processing protein DprA [Bacillota bacterium]
MKLTALEFLIWLNGIEVQKQKREALWAAYKADRGFLDCPDILVERIGEGPAKNALLTYDKIYLDSIVTACRQSGVKIVTALDEEYPERFTERDFDRPYVLYCLGDVSLLNGKNIAIVGTRHVSAYGRRATERFAEELTRWGFNIVSGMAMGADAIAHQACLDASGKTVAVLASGFKHAGPQCNIGIYHRILETGLAVTEYPPDFMGQKYTFPRRNRLISALSDAVVITEAGEDSGSLITAEHAIAQDVPVMALPGRIDDPMSQGTLGLIRKYSQAMVYKPEQVLDELGIWYGKEEKQSAMQLDFYESKLLDLLRQGDLHYDMIFEAMEKPVGELNNLLMQLEIKKLIRRNGASYRLA